MKKLLKVSLVAILAAGPVAAFAATAPIAYVGGATADANGHPTTITPASNVLATKTYVQGAYNALAEGINAEATKTGALSSLDTANFTSAQSTDLATAVNAAMAAAKTAAAGNGLDTAGVKEVIDSAAGNGLNGANGVLSVDLQDNSGLAVTSDGLALSDATKTSLGLADTALQSTSTLNGAKLDTGTVAKTALATDVQTSLGLANTALQADSALNGANLNTGSVAKTALATDVQADLDLAHTALQSAALDGLASETYVDNKAAATLQSAQNYVDARGVVAANTWNSDTTVLVTLSSSAN